MNVQFADTADRTLKFTIITTKVDKISVSYITLNCDVPTYLLHHLYDNNMCH